MGKKKLTAKEKEDLWMLSSIAMIGNMFLNNPECQELIRKEYEKLKLKKNQTNS